MASVALRLALLSLFVPTVLSCAGGGLDPNASGSTAAPDTTIPPTTTTTNGDAAACSATSCDFSKGNACGYTPGSESPAFSNQNSRLSLPNTGVAGPVNSGGNYQGVELKPGESAVLQSGPLALTDQKSLIVKFYEAVDGIQLKACSNDVNTGCQDLSKVGVAAGDRSWQTTSYPIPKDTTKVLLVAKNTGDNKGAVGIDSINLANGEVPAGTTIEDDKKICK